jgi:hypothetical protein
MPQASSGAMGPPQGPTPQSSNAMTFEELAAFAAAAALAARPTMPERPRTQAASPSSPPQTVNTAAPKEPIAAPQDTNVPSNEASPAVAAGAARATAAPSMPQRQQPDVQRTASPSATPPPATQKRYRFAQRSSLFPGIENQANFRALEMPRLPSLKESLRGLPKHRFTGDLAASFQWPAVPT